MTTTGLLKRPISAVRKRLTSAQATLRILELSMDLHSSFDKEERDIKEDFRRLHDRLGRLDEYKRRTRAINATAEAQREGTSPNPNAKNGPQ